MTNTAKKILEHLRQCRLRNSVQPAQGWLAGYAVAQALDLSDVEYLAYAELLHEAGLIRTKAVGPNDHLNSTHMLVQITDEGIVALDCVEAP